MTITEDADRWHSAIRFAVGQDSTLAQIDYAVEEIAGIVHRVLWISR
ncbi:hypothetical protein [Halorubrum trueperi]